MPNLSRFRSGYARLGFPPVACPFRVFGVFRGSPLSWSLHPPILVKHFFQNFLSPPVLRMTSSVLPCPLNGASSFRQNPSRQKPGIYIFPREQNAAPIIDKQRKN